MKKLFALGLALMLVVSSTGVTIAAMTCTRTHTSAECQHEKSQHKSCCVPTVKRLALKDSYAAPAHTTVVVPFVWAGFPAVAVPTLEGSASVAASLNFATSQSTAREYCALVSTFRI